MKIGVDIILEYVPNGSLRMALNKCKYFDETKTAIYTKQILEGLQYLHKNNIIHRYAIYNSLIVFVMTFEYKRFKRCKFIIGLGR